MNIRQTETILEQMGVTPEMSTLQMLHLAEDHGITMEAIAEEIDPGAFMKAIAKVYAAIREQAKDSEPAFVRFQVKIGSEHRSSDRRSAIHKIGESR
jgi:hypothetical protein